MDNLAIWIVILILAYAVYRLWRSTVEMAREHVEHIKKLEWKVEHLEKNSTYHREEIDRLRKDKVDMEEYLK
jgi:cell division protein FtsB